MKNLTIRYKNTDYQIFYAKITRNSYIFKVYKLVGKKWLLRFMYGKIKRSFITITQITNDYRDDILYFKEQIINHYKLKSFYFNQLVSN